MIDFNGFINGSDKPFVEQAYEDFHPEVIESVHRIYSCTDKINRTLFKLGYYACFVAMTRAVQKAKTFHEFYDDLEEIRVEAHNWFDHFKADLIAAQEGEQDGI